MMNRRSRGSDFGQNDAEASNCIDIRDVNVLYVSTEVCEPVCCSAIYCKLNQSSRMIFIRESGRNGPLLADFAEHRLQSSGNIETPATMNVATLDQRDQDCLAPESPWSLRHTVRTATQFALPVTFRSWHLGVILNGEPQVRSGGGVTKEQHEATVPLTDSFDAESYPSKKPITLDEADVN